MSGEQAASINLPSSVFASEYEEEVGLLNKAAPISGEESRLTVSRRRRFTDLCWRHSRAGE